MKVTNENVKQLADELRAYIGEMTDDCACDVKAVEGVQPAIEVIPAVTNTTGSLFYGEEITDFCRGKHLSYWVGAEANNGFPYAYAHIF